MKRSRVSPELNMNGVSDAISQSIRNDPPHDSSGNIAISLSNRIIATSGSFLLIFAAVFCSMGAIISAFSFSVEFSRLVPSWLGAALLFSILASLLRGKSLLVLSPLILIIYAWRLPEIANGARQAVLEITTEYSKWLQVPVFFPGNDATIDELTLFFAVTGVLIALALTISICLQRSAFLTFAYTVPFVFFTIVLTESSPDVRYFLGLMGVYLTLAICSFLYPRNHEKRAAAVFPSLALSLLLLFVAYAAAPPSSYRRSTLINDLDGHVRRIAQQLGLEINRRGSGWPAYADGDWRFDTEHIRVSGAGSRNIRGTDTLTVNSSLAGTFYLRGFSMVTFEDGDWFGSSHTRTSMFSNEMQAITMPGLIVDTYMRHYPGSSPEKAYMTAYGIGDSSTIEYSPYYSLPVDYERLEFQVPYQDRVTQRIELEVSDALGEQVSDALREQVSDALREQGSYALGEQGSYALGEQGISISIFIIDSDARNDTVQAPPDYVYSSMSFDFDGAYFYHTGANVLGMYDVLAQDESLPSGLTGYGSQMRRYQVYTQIDEVTAAGLRELALEAGIDPYADRAKVADQVASYVSSSARYTLNPYVIPDGEDFALHFLEVSKRGYCIHFATAATLMLRALEIPARFTCGFLVTVPPDSVGVDITVTDRNAHAWVEVFYDGVGWLPLEVTPSSTGSGIPAPWPHTAIAPSPAPAIDDASSQSLEYPQGYPMDYPVDYYAEEIVDTPSLDAEVLPSSNISGRGIGSVQISLIFASCFVACVAALRVNRYVKGKKRLESFSQSDTNAAVLYAYGYLSRLSLRDPPPEEIEAIATKARYSTHRVTEEERVFVIDKTVELADSLYKYYRFRYWFWLKHILGL